VDIVRLGKLPLDDLQPLLVESREQGFEFLDRLVAEYHSGANRFAGAGEALFGVYSDRRMIAIGGLNRDPYQPGGDTGRVRRVYVLTAWRRQGIGRFLVETIIDEAKLFFARLTLRTLHESAGEFYRAIGFQTEPKIEDATHHFVLSE
jgi:GNAT superfamily N-acetyltransferase